MRLQNLEVINLEVINLDNHGIRNINSTVTQEDGRANNSKGPVGSQLVLGWLCCVKIQNSKVEA